MQATGGPGRVRSGVVLGFWGALSLLGALLIHEWLVFGPSGHDLIAAASAPCPEVPCITFSTIVTAQIAKAIGAAMLFAVIGAIWVTGARRWAVGVPVWLAEYLWSLVGIASSHRAAFGEDWRWWEPFATLMWSPILTPALALLGIGLWYGLDRASFRANDRV
jgi:hypothetical protein